MKTRNYSTSICTLLALITAAIVPAQAQSIYTPYAFTNFAGQPGGVGVADGTGKGARFHSPSAAAVDHGGNVYVADQINFIIRKITPGGVVTTIAGSPGAIGTNDGIGSAARFGNSLGTGPTGVAVDAATNVYVSDTGNYTIRKIAQVGTNWVVTTLAGSPTLGGTNDGTGTAAHFNGPAGMATDIAGNIYVTDGFAIRQVTPAGVVTTLAGSGFQAGSNDGTNGVARFGVTVSGGPKSVAVDGSTNIYVADTYNDTIRKITPLGTNWITTTIAGSVGAIGFADGTNAVPRFDNPYGVAIDSGGNLYVSDSPSETIRKIAFNGTNRIVTTIAGSLLVFGSDDGTNEAARFQTPEGLAADSAGHLYVADFGNSLIREITPVGTNWVVTTLAGEVGGPGLVDGVGNAARFNIPHGVAVDTASNLYVSDTFNHTIRRITPAGVVTTIAGSPGNHGFSDGVGTAQSARFSTPQGLSVDTASNLYVADSANQTIRKITPSAVVTTFAGQPGITGSANGTGTGASFKNPNATAVDPDGIVYVADSGNRTIRKILSDGTVSLFAGSTGLQGTNDGVGTAARFSSPQGIAVDNLGTTYVADQGGDTIRKITSGGSVTTLAGLGNSSGTNDGVGSAARFTGPLGVAVDSSGNVYVSDTGNNTIRMITPGGTVTTLAGTAGLSGNTDGTNNVARFNAPRGITVDNAGNIYVADASSSTIRKLVINGTNCIVTTLAGTAGQTGSVDGTGSGARFHFVGGVAADRAGNLYATDKSNDDIRKITPAGVVTTFAGTPGLTGTADGSGAAAQFYGPEDLTVDSAGNIYVVEFFNNAVRKIAPSGTNWIITTLAGCPSCGTGTNDGIGDAARFNSPFGLTLDNSGNLFVADTSSFTIRKITPSSTNWMVTTFAGAAGQQGLLDQTGNAARFNGPVGLGSDTIGNIYVADGYSIRMITPAAKVTTLAGCPSGGCLDAIGSADGPGSVARFGLPRDVAVDRAGNIYVADSYGDTIRKLTLSGTNWMVTTLGGVPFQASGADGVGSDARFNQPSGIAVDAGGSIYAVDAGENRVTKGTVAAVAPVVQFDTGSGSLTVSNGAFQMRVTGPSSGSVVLEASSNLQSWTPIQTDSLSGGAVMLTVPLVPGPHEFFRAYIVP